MTALHLRNKCLLEAGGSNARVMEAFKRATRGQPGAEKLSGISLLRSMQRRRRDATPPAPTDAPDADKYLTDERYSGSLYAKHYLGMVQAIADDGGHEGYGLLFGSLNTIRHLGEETKIIQVDGTFRTAPSTAAGRFYQILIFHAKFGGHVMPFFKAIMTGKKRRLYDQVFVKIKQFLPEGVSPSVVLTDFEPALQGALAAVFPEASVRGCWFHFSQV